MLLACAKANASIIHKAEAASICGATTSVGFPPSTLCIILCGCAYVLQGPAKGENGTYNAYSFTREAVHIVQSHGQQLRAQKHASTGAGTGAGTSTGMVPPLFVYIAWQSVHGPYEVPAKFRELFASDPTCPKAIDNPTCCALTTDGHSPTADGTTMCRYYAVSIMCCC